MSATFSFERLDVYNVILEYIALIDPICAALPKGEAETRSQLKRASLSILNNLCEGAGRWGTGEKGNFYSISRGSALECAGTLVWIAARRLGISRPTLDAKMESLKIPRYPA